MNDVQSLIDRQLGLPCRYGYDSVVRRLVVREAEWWHGLGAAGTAGTVGAEDPPIFACRFAEAPGLDHILALANEDGRVAIQDTSKTRSEGSLEGFQCHNNAVFDLTWMPGTMTFVTVSGDHTACLWDVSEAAPRRVVAFHSHSRSVKSVAPRPRPAAPALFATGGRDGHVLLWDIRASQQPAAIVFKPDNSLLSCHSSFAPKTPASHGKRARLDTPRPVSITGLVFQDENTLISCGEFDGNIKVWDLRKNYSIYTREPLPKHSIPYCGSSTRNGYTNLIVDSSRVRLYASCMDNVIYCFNIATYSSRPERRYRGHENASFYIKTSLSPDCRYLVSGSSDKYAYIWNVACSHPCARLSGHRAEVTCAAWARSPTPVLVTCSDDARHKIWRVGREYEDEDPLELCGRAEIVPRTEAEERWGAADRTPASAKRRAQTPASHGGKILRRVESSRRTKRCLTDLLNAARDTDEPTNKKDKSEESKPKSEESNVLPLLHAGSKRSHPPSDTDTPSKRSCLEEETERRVGFVTPTKLDREALSPVSPNTLPTPDSSPNTRICKFASALPDFVRDGEAPHLRLMSPIKRKLDTTDWLTLMVREKRAKVEPSASAPASPKENAPPRRGSTSERTPKPTTNKNKTLLKYFKVATKDKI